MSKKRKSLSRIFIVIFFLVAVALISKISEPSEINPQNTLTISTDTSSNYNYQSKSSPNSINKGNNNSETKEKDNPSMFHSYTIVLDPGHGDYDSGSIGAKGTLEKDIALDVTLKLGKVLERKGMKVIYTREDDTVFSTDINEDLIARANIANKNSADLFISIHLNCCDSPEVSGTETYYHPASTSGKALAEKVQSEIVKTRKLADRGVKADNFLVLRTSKAPAILVELGYISNSKDETILNNSRYQEILAKAIANGIVTYLEVE